MNMEELHHEGAQRFGWAWIDANQLVIAAAQEAGADHAKSPLRLVLGTIAFAICERDERRAAEAGKEKEA